MSLCFSQGESEIQQNKNGIQSICSLATEKIERYKRKKLIRLRDIVE